MAGDGTGSEIVITLPEETRLRSVGLINGYAKQRRRRAERLVPRQPPRPCRSSGSSTTAPRVPQDLGDTTVRAVGRRRRRRPRRSRCAWSRCRQPGTGPTARDFTAISDLLLVAALAAG